MKLTVQPTSPTTQGLMGLFERELADAMIAQGQQAYRARQVFDWIYRHGAASFDQMNNLPTGMRAELAGDYHIAESTVVAEQHASDGTKKLLLRWANGSTSECVLIPDGTRRTACISTQVGCPVRCAFCASGMEGLSHDLTAAQIVEQAMRVRALCLAEGTRLSNVVFMGLGEPLANYRNTVRALRIINDARAIGIAARKITVSTVGLPKQMRRLADEGMQITLALSLHAPDDTLRRELIPWAERVPIRELIDACAYYFNQTGREVTLEYVLLREVNDRPQHASALARLCRDMRANVNLIRYNPVASLPFDRPTAEDAQTFLEILRQRGITAHLRRSRGLDIDSACGQLRRRVTESTQRDAGAVDSDSAAAQNDA